MVSWCDGGTSWQHVLENYFRTREWGVCVYTYMSDRDPPSESPLIIINRNLRQCGGEQARKSIWKKQAERGPPETHTHWVLLYGNQ